MGAELWDLIASQRCATLDVIRELDEAELATPSLCEGWAVRDVAGHLVWVATSEPVDIVRDALYGGLRVHQMIADQARVIGSLPTEVLIEKLEKAVDARLRVPGLRVESVLADLIVHNQDIRRPLGIEAGIDPDALLVALDEYLGANRFTGGKKRVRGLRLVATDIDWTKGTGPEVSGPAEALLLAGVGRSVALDDLTGDGVATLASRC